MSSSNGRANGKGVACDSGTKLTGLFASASNGFRSFTGDQIERYTTELQVPFDPRVIEWRVTNTNQQKTRGQVIPYADQRAYTDRLNALFTPAGWTRKYAIHTSANFERSKDQKIVAKVLVTCELTIFGLGSHSATGEEWADNDNAGTSAEAQAFKRSCSCFGLGRYLYHFAGVWVDLDERKRPKSLPILPEWATPQGWMQGLRPAIPDNNGSTRDSTSSDNQATNTSLVSEIEAMAPSLGRGLYRGLLRDCAKVWNPREIGDVFVQRKVLEHMRAAERGLERLAAAIEKAGAKSLNPILASLGISNLERVDNLQTLKRIVVELERVADTKF